jgi:hypothetical protein
MGVALIHHSQKGQQSTLDQQLIQLNKVIRCKQFLLPIITDISRKHSGYKFFTKLEIGMQCYRFELDEESQDLCTTIIPVGKYKSLRVQMGLKCSPYIAQAAMENVLSDIEDTDVYIDDVGAFSSDWDHHVNLLATILHPLHENGFTITRSSVNGPLKKLYTTRFKALEKEDQCHTSYGSSL